MVESSYQTRYCNGPAPRCAARRVGSTRHVELALPIFRADITADAEVVSYISAQFEAKALVVTASPWTWCISGWLAQLFAVALDVLHDHDALHFPAISLAHARSHHQHGC